MLIRWSKSYKRSRVLSTDPIIKGHSGRWTLRYGGAQNVWILADRNTHTSRMMFGRDLDEAKKNASTILAQLLT